MHSNFDIIYNHGLMNPVTVEAENEAEAKKLGLAIYRKNSTALDIFDADFVIKEVKFSTKKAFQYV